MLLCNPYRYKNTINNTSGLDVSEVGLHVNIVGTQNIPLAGY